MYEFKVFFREVKPGYQKLRKYKKWEITNNTLEKFFRDLIDCKRKTKLLNNTSYSRLGDSFRYSQTMSAPSELSSNIFWRISSRCQNIANNYWNNFWKKSKNTRSCSTLGSFQHNIFLPSKGGECNLYALTNLLNRVLRAVFSSDSEFIDNHFAVVGRNN